MAAKHIGPETTWQRYQTFSSSESLGPNDEGNGRLEGPIIAHIAKLHGKNPTYRYVRNRKEFAKAVRSFAKSNYRYLHISAHADHEGIATTNLEEVSNVALAEMLGKNVL